MEHGLLYMNFTNTISEGDGDHIVRVGSSCFYTSIQTVEVPSMLSKLSISNCSNKLCPLQGNLTANVGIGVLIIMVEVVRMFPLDLEV